MKVEEKMKNMRVLLEQTLEVNGRILKDCYWRPTVSPETLTELNELVSAIEEELNTGSV